MANRNRFSILKIAFTTLLLTPAGQASASDSNLESRTAVVPGYKLSDQIKVSLSPEFRFDENLALDKYLYEGEVDYKLNDILALGATYRFIVNPRDDKDTEYFNRIAVSIAVKQAFNRFEPAFRLRYSNYADDDMKDKTFMRYKTSLKYDIPKCKATPVIAIEAFQQVNDFDLYKTRYSMGMSYKLFKKNYLGMSYKYDAISNSNKNAHILGLEYKLKI